MALSEQQIASLRGTIEARRRALGVELREDADKIASEHFGTLGGEPGDSADNAVASNLGNIGRAELERDALEMAALHQALRRIDDGEYGVCTECGADIPLARLQAQPAAHRCTVCQSAHEKRQSG